MSAAVGNVEDDSAPPGHRRTLFGAVLGSGVAFLDTAVVSIALPSIQSGLGGTVAVVQWVMNGYLLAVGAFLLYGGALGDALGQRRVFRAGLVIFGVASLVCGLAPNVGVLVGARALQGIGAALILPSSLPLATAGVRGKRHDRAVGMWTALVGLGAVLGPFAGGWLVDTLSWRPIFLLNLPLAIASFFFVGKQPSGVDTARRHLPSPLGTLLVVLALSGASYALIEGSVKGRTHADVIVAGALAVCAAIALGLTGRHESHPIVPRRLTRSRTFLIVNGLTLAYYGGFNLILFATPMFLQRGHGVSALGSAALMLPIELLLLLLSPAMGRVIGRIGTWPPLIAGPAISACGSAILAFSVRLEGVVVIFAGIVVFAIGFGICVAPLNAALLSSVGDDDRAVGFGVNSAVARIGGLLAIAILPAVALPALALPAGAAGAMDGVVPSLFAGATWLATALCAVSAAGGVLGSRSAARDLAWLVDRPVHPVQPSRDKR